ncbi:hypothetical protein EV361DRAFT_925443 [Lentinula raphanica]|nr:hypothetical protein EV361DRAFT_925443 [Lentinula raphanica]
MMNTKPIIAYPSLSSSLNMLPQATSMSSIPLHANMYTNCVQESQSQAKLQKALDRNKKSSIAPLSLYALLPSASSENFNDNPTLMMRKLRENET